MKSVSANRWQTAVYLLLIFPSLIALPFMIALMFNAASEAFLGNKEPMFATAFGMFVGMFLAVWLVDRSLVMWRAGWKRGWLALFGAILAYELLAIPLARWMIRVANSSPNNVIEWW